MAIAEGQFSQVGTYNIKVEKKSGENGKFLNGVTIHQLSAIGAGSNTVIKAKKGELISSENSNILKLVLKDGNYYEDIIPKKAEDRNKVPFAKSEFKRYVINIDLSKLNNTNLDEGKITNTNTMLNVSELKFTLDSLQKNYNKDVESISENIGQRSLLGNSIITTSSSSPTLNIDNFLQGFTTNDKTQILRVASSNIDATKFSLESSRFELEDKQKNISLHWIALYDKFVIAFACLLMFFIGAPLGAIIRKGGLGLPIVFAILIFIIFHFINTFGKKVAQQNGISPFLGCWMATFILIPLAVLLTKKATDDKGFSITFDWFTNIFSRFNVIKNKHKFNLATIENQVDFDYNETNVTIPSKPTEAPIIAAVTVKNTIETATVFYHYKKYSLFTLISYIVLLTITITSKLQGLTIVISAVVVAFIFYFLLYKTLTLLHRIADQTNQKIDLKNYIVMLGAFPFYPLFYFYYFIYLKEVLSKYNKDL